MATRELFRQERILIRSFLSKVPPRLEGMLREQQSSIFLLGESVIICCKTVNFAHSLTHGPRYRHLIAAAKELQFEEITILSDDDSFCRNLPIIKQPGTPQMSQAENANYPFKIMPHTEQEQQIEARVSKHQSLIKAIGQGVVAVTIHDCNPETGFAYLDVYAPLTERLNKQKSELIGMPVRSVAPEIAEPRYYAIKKAISNGDRVSYHYTYDDDFHWKFNVEVAPLAGTEEVITIVRDAELWQAGHWLNKRLSK